MPSIFFKSIDILTIKKYDKKLYDKNSTTNNWQSAKKYKKYDKTFVYYRVVGKFNTQCIYSQMSVIKTSALEALN